MADQSNTNNKPSLSGTRVIIVLGPLVLGGSERQALLFANYLKREQGADVQVWGMAPGRAASLCDEYDVPWQIVPCPWGGRRFELVENLVKFGLRLRRARPDIILPYMEAPNLVCGLLWRWTGARLCVWNQRDDGSSRMKTRYAPLAIWLTPRFIANSGHAAEHLVKTLGVPTERVSVVYNGIEVGHPDADGVAWRQRLALSQDCLAVCAVANLTIYKDHNTLLRAWRLVLDRLLPMNRQAVLLLAGRLDETADTVKALAYDLELGSSVRFLGEVADVSGLLGAADIGALCSNSEGSPNSVLEYMKAGLAVAGTDIPGIREALSSENHAFLAPPGDAETLAERFLELAADVEVRARLGATNRQRIEANFSPRRMCEETLAIIVKGADGNAPLKKELTAYEVASKQGR
jgi:glycosyltransferase involved in cell wall biosynthesis